jgi:protein O-mannosyl-transferase
MSAHVTSTAHWSHRALVLGLLMFTLAMTAVVFWPSLRGSFVFDDYPNIVDNPAVHPTTLSWESLRDAAFSSPVDSLPRPLAMLSFALDWCWSPGDIFHMKLVNLCIHLLNGLLLFALLRRIVRIASDKIREPQSNQNYPELLALCVTAAWLLAPINFTAVAYIVQRMESLCQVFVLAGLWAYVAARERMLATGRGAIFPWMVIVFATGLGVLVKESAALMPVYAFILEWLLFGFARRDGKLDRKICAAFAVLLALPGTAAMLWAMHRYLPAAAWAGRPFTLAQRLLTEPRILLEYVNWTLLPTANALSLYHDNIDFSLGWFSPATTTASIIVLLGMLAAAFYVRNTRPLVALGLLWFLAAHLLTGTIIPLELVFEHRNYFASVGLYLAAFSLLAPWSNRNYRVARMTGCVALLILFATVTWIRAMDWGNPLTFARSEAEKNPNSHRAAYELGRTYVIFSRYQPESPFVPLAYAILDKAATMPHATALPDQALLLLSSNLHRDLPPGTWQRLQDKLANQPLSMENIAALYAVTQCEIKAICQYPPEQMIASYQAALSHVPRDVSILTMYANFATSVLHNQDLAIQLTSETVDLQPQNMQPRINMLLILHVNEKDEQALDFYHKTAQELPSALKDPVFLEWGKLLEGPKPDGTKN